VSRRSPVRASALNAIIPGLGHLYVGRAKRAILMLVGMEGISVVLGQFGLFASYAGLLLFYLIHGVWIYLIYDSFALAKRSPDAAPKWYMHKVWYAFYAVVFLVVSTLLGAYRAELYGFDLYPVRDDLMAPTLAQDDLVLVDAKAYRGAGPGPGDVVVIDFGDQGLELRRVKSADSEGAEVAVDDPTAVQYDGYISLTSIRGRVTGVVFSSKGTPFGEAGLARVAP
jgi:signal peptidase I